MIDALLRLFRETVVRRGVDQHSDFLPAVPIGRDGEGAGLRGVVVCEGVEEVVGRAVVDLSKAAED